MRNRTIRVGIVGVGNCASSLVQGVAFYQEAIFAAPNNTYRFADVPRADLLVRRGATHVAWTAICGTRSAKRRARRRTWRES